jgi:two-component system sensor histidine kinase BaeS
VNEVSVSAARRGQPLSLRLAAVLAIAVLAVLLITGIAVNRFVSRSLEDELTNAQRDQIGFLADQLDGLTLPYASRITQQRVNHALTRLARFVNGRVALLDPDGQTAVSFGDLPSGIEPRRIEEPIPGGGSLTLLVELPVSQQPFLRVFNATLMIAGILSVLVLVAVAALLSSRLTRPLRGLAAAARQLGAGDLSARAAGGPDRESAELADAFNAMASRLEQSEALRRRAASDVAHDLATPATVLESQLQAMIDGVVPADAEQLERARAAAGAMSGVVAQLRDLVDVEAASLQRQAMDLAVSTLVSDARSALEPLYRERDVTLEVSATPDQLLVHADRVQVGRALRNVLTNAAQHAPAGSSVALQVAGDGARIAIRVTDHGQGIADADLPHVFERFYRVDRSRQPAAGGGSGIGLTIARELLAANGGTIEVERTGPTGTTFLIGLPAAA